MNKKTGAKNKKQNKSYRQWLIKVPVLLAAVYLLGLFVSGRMQVNTKQKELVEIQTKIEQQDETNAELQEIMDAGDQDAYIERIAREKLGYAKPEERIFIDVSGE